MTEAGEAALRRFHEWCRAEGVTYDEEAVDITTHADGTMGIDRYHYAVYAKRNLAVDTPVVTAIPKAACLSARTCSVAETLREARLGGGLALNIAIMHERSLGEGSRWAGYFAVLPARGERTLPMFWTPDQLEHLRGTDLLRHVTEDAESMRLDFRENVVDGLCVTHPASFPPGKHTLEAYMEAASLAASRAFFIGEECGEALVPWADMFNHKTDGEHVHVLGADDDDDDEVCPPVDGDDEEEGESEEEESEEEESEEEESEEENEQNEEEEEEEEEEGPIEPPTGSLVIHACAPAEKGDELFNTFGQQNNASLLHKYGFCELHNAYTNVCVDVALVEDVVGGTKVRDAAAELGVDVADDEYSYFEIEPDGTIEEALLAVLGRAHRGEDEEDDPTTESPDVQASLRTILERRAAMYVGKGKGKGKGEESGAIPRGIDDWGSVGDAVPAGGGAVGVDAARVLRDAELGLLRLAIERNCGVGNKRRRV